MSVNYWVLAARPATLWAGVAPVVVGTALAIDDGAFDPGVFAAALVAAVAVQVGVNFANDLADAKSGADTDQRIGPPRAVAAGLLSPRAMAIGVAAAFGVAAIAGMYLTFAAGPIVPILGVASLVAALGYTAGPYPYGYHGLGEVFVFIFFGLVATVGTRFVFDESAPAEAWVSGVVMGLLATAILIANNVRDIDTDRAAGKRTLAVIIGRPATRRLFLATVAGSFVIVVIAAVGGTYPTGALLMVIAAPLALSPIRNVWRHVEGPELIAALKGTARLQIVAAVLLGAGLIV
jgi:1,4-dihydroxy-2-naphthoate octaprenyltransferase